MAIDGQKGMKHVGTFPLTIEQQIDGNCMPTAYWILSGTTLDMPSPDFRNEKKTLDFLRAAGKEVELIKRSRFEDECKPRGIVDAQPCDDPTFFQKAEVSPSILIDETDKLDENSNPKDH